MRNSSCPAMWRPQSGHGQHFSVITGGAGDRGDVGCGMEQPPIGPTMTSKDSIQGESLGNIANLGVATSNPLSKVVGRPMGAELLRCPEGQVCHIDPQRICIPWAQKQDISGIEGLLWGP